MIVFSDIKVEIHSYKRLRSDAHMNTEEISGEGGIKIRKVMKETFWKLCKVHDFEQI